MKQLIFCLFIIFSFDVVKSQDISEKGYPDRFENSQSIIQKNKIASLTVYRLESVKNKLDSVKIATIYYDKTGKLSEIQAFYDNKELFFRTNYTYNDVGKLSKIIRVNKDNSEFKELYEYDNLGRKSKIFISNNSRYTELITFKFNILNQLIEKEYYDVSTFNNELKTRLVKKKTYSYNDSGILIKIEELVDALRKLRTHIYVVGENNIYKSATSQISGDTYKPEFEFDKLNNCKKVNYITKYISSSKTELIPEIEEYEYAKDGTILRTVNRSEEEIYKVHKYHYTYYSKD